MTSLSLAFDVLAHDRASDTFDKVGRKADGLGSKLSGVGKIAGAAIGGAAVAAVAGLGAAMVQGVKDAVSYETLANKTAAVLESTGNVANTSVKGIQSLAAELEHMSGVDEELIINSQNVLATFTNIRNVGEDKIFDKATASALDMSVALGQDLQGATTMLGKALNDPIAGISAMSRAGVQFTDDQKNLIKTLVESGDTLGAQKVILGELETQFGGAAKAAGSGFAGDLARLKDAFSDAFRDVGAKILPLLADLAGWLGDKLPGAIDAVFGAFDKIKVGVEAFFAAVRDGDVTSDGFIGVMETIGDFIHRRLLPAFDAVVDFVKGNMTVALSALAGVVVAVVLPPFVAWAAATIAAAAPVLALMAAVGLLVGAVVYAYQNFEGFRNIVDGVVDWFTGTAIPAIADAAEFMQDAIGTFVAWFRDDAAPVILRVVDWVADKFSALLGWVQDVWPAIQEAIGHVMRAIKEVIGVVIDAISAVWRAWGDDLFTIAKAVFEAVRETIDNVLQVVRGLISTVLALINGDWGKAWDGIKQILAGIWDQITNIIDLALEAISAILGGALSMLSEVWSGAWDGIKSVLSGIWDAITGLVEAGVNAVVDFFLDMAEDIVGAAASAFGWVPVLGDKLRDAADAVKQFRDDVNRYLGGITKTVSVGVNLIRPDIGAAQVGALKSGGGMTKMLGGSKTQVGLSDQAVIDLANSIDDNGQRWQLGMPLPAAMEALASRIRDIFADSGVAIATVGESADRRIERIIAEIREGRTLDSVRRSVDWIQGAGLADTGGWTGGDVTINVEDRSGNPVETARSTALALKMAL